MDKISSTACIYIYIYMQAVELPSMYEFVYLLTRTKL